MLVAGDVKKAKFAQKVVARTIDAFGRLDVLVNNAAFQEHAGSLEEITDERLEETFRTNISRLLPHGAGGVAAPQGGRLDHQHRLGHGSEGQREAVRLFGDQGGDPRVHEIARAAGAARGASPAYVFLASPVCAGYNTGIVLPVTGSVGAI